MNVEVISFGCRLNLAEGERIRAAAAAATDTGDLVVINSCAVTSEAVRQARQAVRRISRQQPGARIIVTGCAAETEPAMFTGIAEIVGNRAKGDQAAYAPHPRFEADVKAIEPAVSGADHARAFIEVQNGCDHRCTFCIIPYGRGESRSIPAGAVIDAVRAAVDRGQQEVVLTGVDLTSYGPDLPGQPTLGMLVERILHHVPQLRRLRLSSLDSVEIDDRLFALICGEPRLMPHVHLSLQSGDDMILKRMKRRHSRADAIGLVERLKSQRPDIAIGADIIAGFPTETDAMFESSLSLIEACDIVFGHIFPYSPRPGTPAARMPQLERPLIKARATELRARAAGHKARWLQSQVGSVRSVLVELDNQTGHAENFAPVKLETPLAASNMRGTMMNVRITASDGLSLAGVPA